MVESLSTARIPDGTPLGLVQVGLAEAPPSYFGPVQSPGQTHGYRRGYTEGHRRADREQPALPKAGRLEPVPELAPIPWQQPREAFTPWVFAGGWDKPVGSAEYELLTQTAELAWIAQWTAQGNIDRHTIQAGE